jgi:protein CpxP
MKSTITRIAAAAALAACALGAGAQMPPPAAPGSQAPGMHQHDPARMHEQMQKHMQERHAKRMERLKRILQVTPQQEGAWAAFAGAMQPAARAPHNRDEFARMTTPQRIDALKQRRAQRIAEQDRRGDATKTFYAQLSPSQQKAFDEVSLKMLSRGAKQGGERGGMHMRHHGGWNS